MFVAPLKKNIIWWPTVAASKLWVLLWHSNWGNNSSCIIAVNLKKNNNKKSFHYVAVRWDLLPNPYCPNYRDDVAIRKFKIWWLEKKFQKNIFMLYDILICHLKNRWISSQVNSSTTSNIIVFCKHCSFFTRQTNSAILCCTFKFNEM